MNVTDSEMNEFTHTVADALSKLLGQSGDCLDRCALNQQLEEQLLKPYYDVRVVEDGEDE